MGNTQMTLAPGASAGVTATPGSMMPDNPEAAHMMEPITAPDIQPASETEGGQPLAFRDENGVKVFELTTKAVQWPILDGVTVTAFTYNGTVPGPMIRVTEGDQVRIVVKNELPDPTTIHWHGVEVPNAMDGVPGVTQDPIQPGETFTYEFIAKPAGTFMYHSHFEGDVQVSAGLYAPFIIDPKEPEANPPAVDAPLMISEWRMTDGQTFAAMPMGGMEPNFFTINGKSFPATETITVKKGDLVRLRLISIGQFIRVNNEWRVKARAHLHIALEMRMIHECPRWLGNEFIGKRLAMLDRILCDSGHTVHHVWDFDSMPVDCGRIR